ncbi:cytochrome P450 [Lentinula aff. lateritia]|uniref:Cytochrome P450 n=1 Tax=Lentinula aff. lateritia TaxID=2804960 RepID=A0ACC1UCU6_9AGAR|nr:cytochrome P450 [Lentinula aff. lateritia]
METATLLILCLLVVALFLFKNNASSPLWNIQGPKSSSFILGHLRELLQRPAGLAEFEWQRTYGDVVRIRTSFGCQTQKPSNISFVRATNGVGVQFVEKWEEDLGGRTACSPSPLWSFTMLTLRSGETHIRHRKLMTPGFRATETQKFLPIFIACAEAMSSEWKKSISNSADQSCVFDLTDHLSHATLDAIGLAAFDYDFGSISNHENELAKAYEGLTSATSLNIAFNAHINVYKHRAKAFRAPSNMGLVMLDLFRLIPSAVMEFMNDHNPRLETLHHVAHVGNGVAKQLIAQKVDEIEQGTPDTDIYTSLVQSNLSESSKSRLSDEELVAQMRTLLFGGHETTTNSICWAAYELARNPELQDKLRTEIRSTERKIADCGESEFTLNDYEEMPLLNAICKETLRFHPIALHLFRTANEDDVIPLSKPIVGKTGQLITEIPVPKGTRIVGSCSAYNRNLTIFGEDAHEFNPNRWLEGRVKTEDNLGFPYANLATFAAGVRSCIGWRFAVAELQTFIVVLLRNFTIRDTPKLTRIRRESALTMVPAIEGELDKGTQLPIRVYLGDSCVVQEV